MNKKDLKLKYLYDFLETFWYAPCDALLRSVEAVIISKATILSPSLDVGCGDGRISKLLFGKRIIDIGVDPGKKEASLAAKSGVYKSVLALDAASLPFKDGHFRTIIVNSTFEHIKHDKQVLKELSRVTKKGGIIYLTVPSDKYLKLLKSLGLNGARLKNFNIRVAHYHYRTKEDWEKMLSQVGLKATEMQYYFPKQLAKMWLLLFRLTTFKVYRRELWSYLKDSPYGKLVPKNLVIYFLKRFISPAYRLSFEEGGGLLYIKAVKK
ncbi:MAG: Methyltransferase-like protein [Candidatus Woesebacteria bacterium GW2011_GWB1_38_5b]|uniref:Methyltransferase-like protein n=1 Tax=Candidatus Woesebacteria bacterium GW2011_GWB1_38_5b TaxID=1618569 RepID=A0A0G0KKB3_9BACT|nr:MAG: Methyltransferase-like protein [Candidatus Woesebacteria bacterium GW2011_GWB1_38_5b]